MVSTIGRPVMVDKVTQSRSMVKYARILVDMEITDHPPKSISFINERDQITEQVVEYEWLPSKCAACSNLGHILANCNKNTGLSWRKKSTDEKGTSTDNNISKTEEVQQHSESVNLDPRACNASNIGEEERASSSLEQNVSKVISDVQDNSEVTQHTGKGNAEVAGSWITPRRRGARQGVVIAHKSDFVQGKAKSGNGYVVLQDTGIGHLVTNSIPIHPIVSGRILVVWQTKFVKVDILLEDPQLVHCRIKVSGQQDFFFATVVYGSNSMGERKHLWDKLASIGLLKSPWIIFGDFNAMFSYQDRIGGRQVLAKDIADAQNWLALGQVEELKCEGAPYSWTNKQEAGDRIFSKLDRVFINDLWLDVFPKTEARFKWDCISDHSFCVIRNQEYRGYREVVLRCWNAPVVSGGGLCKIVQKLYRVKHILKRFNREEVGDIVLSYKKAKEEYSRVQEALASNPSDMSLLQSVTQAQLNVSVLQSCYANFLKQQRGKTEEDYSKVVEHFLSHFKNFMGKGNLASVEIDKSCFMQGNRLSLDLQVRLLRPFTKNDVKKALFSIHSYKSPGLDGFGSGFFKGLWSDIGAEITSAVLDFFHDGYLPKDLNETMISLIPKLANPSSASDYRPIACCNTLYKCISKMICSRLSEVLPFLVHSNQGAFIKNRVLAHNIMIFQDLLKGYTRKNISARCLMKIDLSKAYDTVDWHFVEELLKHLCFPSRFIGWILVCLKGTKYNLLMNGRIQGSFKGEKGLRQGDPMSPLLFVLIMEYLTRLLAHYSDKKGFGYHPLCKHLRLTNLCFADDLIIFCKGNVSSVSKIHEAFSAFCDSTGLFGE
ncbi:uncharacterized protein LOC133826231 [Humulus lupulus]|uniref:uncharacterized protein LOC133826231 n=1 Tax=Humulus lupulus TaxID=3486 RepID=UPI002B4012A0|nr:uncharacterized protein LOC133826231 [Humulus lupulus]